MSNIFYVYVHRKLDTNEIFYIGKGKDKRAYDTNRSEEWKNIVSKHGFKVEFIDYNLSEDEALNLEMLFIKTLGRIDLKTGILVNLAEGKDVYKKKPVDLNIERKRVFKKELTIEEKLIDDKLNLYAKSLIEKVNNLETSTEDSLFVTKEDYDNIDLRFKLKKLGYPIDPVYMCKRINNELICGEYYEIETKKRIENNRKRKIEDKEYEEMELKRYLLEEELIQQAIDRGEIEREEGYRIYIEDNEFWASPY